ncbi:hypothetical protein H6F76_05335 [Leptolyngbya sp. FACHB-321]|uniref:hypothetical protein n=1 Tax=Leptolyngbya sp. FACHB-321 TaxID=2692807 RepID=UPI0016836F31|nr:hypothetical protein [Leptolyngbya sp. FACHB-321]MBD2034458.1 hypothetical protein [Leptolyngbya sp. FACHB-321]
MLKITNEHGHDTDKYRQVALSDGEGGMYPLCEHQHDSMDETENCPEALARTEAMAGVSDGGHADRVTQLEVEAAQLLAEAAQLKGQEDASKV